VPKGSIRYYLHTYAPDLDHLGWVDASQLDLFGTLPWLDVEADGTCDPSQALDYAPADGVTLQRVWLRDGRRFYFRAGHAGWVEQLDPEVIDCYEAHQTPADPWAKHNPRLTQHIRNRTNPKEITVTNPILAQLSSEYRRTDGGYDDGGQAQLTAQFDARLAGLETPIASTTMSANLGRLIWTKTGPAGPEGYRKGVNNTAPFYFEVVGPHGVALPSVTLGDSDDARTLWPRMSDTTSSVDPLTGEVVEPLALIVITEPMPGRVDPLTGRIGTDKFRPVGVIIPTHTRDTDASVEWVTDLLLEARSAYPWRPAPSSVVIDGDELAAQVRGTMRELMG